MGWNFRTRVVTRVLGSLSCFLRYARVRFYRLRRILRAYRYFTILRRTECPHSIYSITVICCIIVTRYLLKRLMLIRAVVCVRFGPSRVHLRVSHARETHAVPYARHEQRRRPEPHDAPRAHPLELESVFPLQGRRQHTAHKQNAGKMKDLEKGWTRRGDSF